MLAGERLLIIEEVFLIALDIQRVVESANAQQAVFARNFEEASALAESFGTFDLAIVNPPGALGAGMRIAELLVKAGVGIVVCTAARLDLSATPLAGAEIVTKPFLDEDLVAACRSALAKRQR